jgi:type VI secretion system secreted protein VgrG
MSTFIQTSLPVQITTPLGPNKLLVKSFEGEEQISGLFQYTIELYSEDASLAFADIVGQAVTLAIPLSSGDQQYVNGVVGRFTQAGRDGRFVTYIAELHPWLWLLTKNSDCRIYQNKSSIDIIKQVFSDLGFSDFEDKTTGTYDSREYCVQYRESTFAFVSRLMEEEGIFYFFTHDSSKHKLVLADDGSSWNSCPGLTSARFVGAGSDLASDDVVLNCSIAQAVTVGQFKADDYNFTTPSTDLLATSSGADTKRSVYDYPGLYTDQGKGEKATGIRLAAFEAEANLLQGESLCRCFHAGAKFTLANHYRPDANKEYVLRWLSVKGTQHDYSNSFSAFPATLSFRPTMLTPRPVIAGTQTATVVGKSGEEIWTDQYGRIIVQFHWDQLGQNDEKSSCWIRVAQGWSGKLWGSLFLPRIGQEVVVSFLEGNPDRPLITGCVFNAEQTVPYTLPDEQTKSTIKTNSSKGGSGFNEIRFEDKAGSEELFLQAQKDMKVTVLNDQTTTITNNRTVTINEKDDTLTISKGNRSVSITKGNETVSVQGTRQLTVTGNETHTNKADYSGNVTGNFVLKVSGNLTIEASGSVTIKSGTDFTNQAGTSLTNKSGTDMTNNAGTTLTNKAAASQTVDGGGMLTIKGGLVKIN